ncbi:hypothetical protein DRN80_03810 [Methanosarcinales archaeon]|nr:MAG: hypothetical protein DRN80_03810 [Methanosarcinales archaeon]
MNELKAVFFYLIISVVLFSSTNLCFADDVDVNNLLDRCEIAPDPKPSVMVYDYKLSPETLMPGDVGVLTITLKNMQDKPIKKKIDMTTTTHYPDVDTETYYTMDAYIKEAHIVEREFKVYNRYTSAGVLGPDSKVDLGFKIKAPLEEGIYMLKFVAEIEDTHGESSKGIRYFIPVVVTGTVNLLPQEVTEDEVRLEVVNEGLSDVDNVYVVAVPSVTTAGMVECQPEKVYIGKIKYGESAIAAFKVHNTKIGEGVLQAVFRAVYKNGINKHESNQICVTIPWPCPSPGYDEVRREQVELGAPTVTPVPTYSSSPGSASALKFRLTGFGAGFAGLFVVVVAVVISVAFVFYEKEKKREVKKDD